MKTNQSENSPLAAAELGLTKLLYEVREVEKILSLGHTTVSLLIKNGELPSLKVGKKRLVHVHAIVGVVNKRVLSTQPIASAMAA